MLQQGFAPDIADSNWRTALMLAAVKGHADNDKLAQTSTIF